MKFREINQPINTITMKHIYSLLILALLVVSCGGDNKNKSVEKVLEGNNLEAMRVKRGELVNEQQSIHDKIKLLDDKIAVLDSTKKNTFNYNF